MKILVLSKYSRKGASSRFRFFQYYPHLQEKGVELVTEALFEDDYLERLYAKEGRLFCVLKSYWRRLWVILSSFNKNYDVVWLEKELFPWVPWFIEKWFLKLLNVPYVVDYDDAIFHQYDQHRSQLVRTLLGTKCDQVLRHSRCFVAGNEYLAQRGQKAGAHTIVKIPTVVSANVFSAKESAESSGPVIGWIGSMSTAIYLEKLRPVLHELSLKHQFKFRVVGASLDWNENALECVPWSEAQEVSLVQSFDIGIMPLLDSPWERGKCGFKLIQYMACGKPVVADPVGVNTEIIEEGQNGFLITEQRSWRQALEILLENPSLRKEMGQRGLKRFCDHYSLERWQGTLFQLFQDCAKIPRGTL